MADKITLEDINTWLMKYEYQTIVFTLDCSKTMGNYGIYSIEGGNIRTSYVKLFLPVDVKLYYPSGGLSYNEQRDWIILQDGDFQLTVILTLNGDDVGGNTKFRKLDWYPISPIKCLRVGYDEMEHRKLFLKINDSNITSINYKEIKDASTDNPYITYGDVIGSLSDNVLWANTENSSRYPFKIIKIPSCPHITVEKELYIGNNNSLDDLISLPSEDIEYKIYYNGKELKDNIFIPRDYNEDTIRLRVVIKSYEPYVGTDVYIEVPVTVKILTTIEDLNNYSYGKINRLYLIGGEINNDIIIQGNTSSTITACDFTINGTVILDGVTDIQNTNIINNDYFEIKSYSAEDTIYIKPRTSKNFSWVNNGDLIINGAVIDNYNGFVLNNGSVTIINSEININPASHFNLAFCHSTTDDVELKNNKFIVKDEEFEFEGYNICIIRANYFDADKFISENTTDYNCNYINNDKTYIITGNGVAYCLIDEDTIRFKNLEVNEDV